MPVKLRVDLEGQGDEVSQGYEFEITAAAGHETVVVGPAEARDLIAELEAQLDVAARIESARLAQRTAPPRIAPGEGPSPVSEGT